jgi:hypothetical protein
VSAFFVFLAALMVASIAYSTVVQEIRRRRRGS